MAALGFQGCVWAFSSCDKQGLLLVAVSGLLAVVASLVEPRLQAGGPGGRGTQAQYYGTYGV